MNVKRIYENIKVNTIYVNSINDFDVNGGNGGNIPPSPPPTPEYITTLMNSSTISNSTKLKNS